MEWPAAPQTVTPLPGINENGLAERCRALFHPLLRGKRHAVGYALGISSIAYKPRVNRQLIRPPTAISMHTEKEVVEADGLLQAILTVTRNVLFIGDIGPSDSLCSYIQTSRIRQLRYSTSGHPPLAPHRYDLVVVGKYHWVYAKEVYALLNYLDVPVVMLRHYERDKRCDFETLVV